MTINYVMEELRSEMIKEDFKRELILNKLKKKNRNKIIRSFCNEIEPTKKQKQ